MKKTAVIMILTFALLLPSCSCEKNGGNGAEQSTEIMTEEQSTVQSSTAETEKMTTSTEASSELPQTEPLQTTLPQTTLPQTTVPQTTKEQATAPQTTVPQTSPPQTTEKPSEPSYYRVTNYEDVKAIWLSQFDLNGVYTDNGVQRSKESFISLLSRVLDNSRACGFNTVFIQIRPNADSFYPSEYYPPSVYVLGDYGREFKYDPIEIAVSLAKERGFSVHAWINPMRGMTDSQIKKIPSGYQVKKWYGDSEYREKYIVKQGSNWYLNPAYAEVRSLIVNGAKEALAYYEFDGLHMDDYFYPTTDAAFDSSAYSQYKAEGGNMSLSDFRRDNLNKLVKALYDGTKEINPSAMYGISPAGNWNTVYNNQYADYKTWCTKDGYIDYICPQVYFGLEHGTYDFVKTASTWESFIKTDSVKLIIGMTLGKAKSGVDEWAGSGKYEWRDNKDVIKRCLLETQKLSKCSGISVFCYQYLYTPIGGTVVPETLEEKNNFLPLLKEMTWK